MLRPYQQRTVAAIRELERTGPATICCQAPTGAGKSVLLADLLLDGTPQLVLTHRKLLLDQLSRVLTAHGIRHGFRAAGHQPDPTAPVQLGMVPTEHARAIKTNRWPLYKCARLHVDEIHAIKADVATRIWEAYHNQGATCIGYTATPREISHLCEHQVVAATVPELIEQGCLVPPVIFGPDQPDAEKLERVARAANGDYAPGQLEKVWNAKTIFGRVVGHYRLLNPDQTPTILFAPGVPQSLWFAQRLTASGIRSAHIDGRSVWLDGKEYQSDTAARQAVFGGVESGDIKIVCNRFVLREGFDLPAISHVILACVFGARTSFVQAVGRGLRPAPGKQRCVIQDHGGNWLRHPPLDSAEPWDMATPERVLAQMRIARMRGETPGEPREIEPINCPKCSCIRITGEECPECGHRYKQHSRMVIQVNGELKLIKGRAYQPRKVVRKPGQDEQWAGLLRGNQRYHPQRTPQQIWAYQAVKDRWRFMPRDLPGMPNTARGWFLPVNLLTPTDLIGGQLQLGEKVQLSTTTAETTDMAGNENGERDICTAKQAALLEKHGLGSDVTFAEASALLDKLAAEQGWSKRPGPKPGQKSGNETGQPTAKQIACLTKHGCDTSRLTFATASAMLDALAANNWQRPDVSETEEEDSVPSFA